jgi:hypothetical protein
MKLPLFIFAICVALLSFAIRANAQNYPWCAYYNGGGAGGGTNCGFTTLQQCMETARGLGSLCQPNTQYVPPPGPHPLTRVQGRNPY